MTLPKPYHEEPGITIYHGDCREILPQLPKVDLVLTDPPYNVGYHYASYKDSLSKEDYFSLLQNVLSYPFVLIHYPEDTFEIFRAINSIPTKCVAWTYNALTPRKWRLISWVGNDPDFSKQKQPFKNLNDKRILEAIKDGKEGASIYDWWHDEQVKNVSAEKTEHPCQIPLEIMKKIISISEGEIILDPFMGSGTTLRAAKDLGRKAIGIEIEEKYCEIAVKRLRQEVFQF